MTNCARCRLVPVLAVGAVLTLCIASPPAYGINLTVRSGPGVSAQAAGEIQRTLLEADDFLSAEFSITVSRQVRVHLSATAEAYVDSILRTGVRVNETLARMGLTPGGHWMMVDAASQIFINLGHPATGDQTRFLSDLSHEMVHIYHQELSGWRGSPYAWIQEGTAEVFAKHFLHHKGLIVYPQTIAAAANLLRERQSVGGLPSLGSLTTPDLWERRAHTLTRRVVYATALVAVDYLVQQKGKDALFRYFRLFRAEPEPEAAFVQAFGQTSLEFNQRLHGYVREAR